MRMRTTHGHTRPTVDRTGKLTMPHQTEERLDTASRRSWAHAGGARGRDERTRPAAVAR